MTLLVLCTVVHYYSTAHLTALTALKQLDGEFEHVAASLKVPFWTTLRRVTVPICLPALLDIARYYFVSGMTTLSAVIFLYTPQTVLSAVAVLNMDDAGDTAAAAAMASLIVATSVAVCIVSGGVSWWALQRTQAGANADFQPDPHDSGPACRGVPVIFKLFFLLRFRPDVREIYARTHPVNPRPTHHHAQNQNGHVVGLGLVGCRL